MPGPVRLRLFRRRLVPSLWRAMTNERIRRRQLVGGLYAQIVEQRQWDKCRWKERPAAGRHAVGLARLAAGVGGSAGPRTATGRGLPARPSCPAPYHMRINHWSLFPWNGTLGSRKFTAVSSMAVWSRHDGDNLPASVCVSMISRCCWPSRNEAACNPCWTGIFRPTATGRASAWEGWR
jgi:hypothetical protein